MATAWVVHFPMLSSLMPTSRYAFCSNCSWSFWYSNVKGVRGFDANVALKGLIQTATQRQRNAGRDHIEDWLKYGFALISQQLINLFTDIAYIVMFLLVPALLEPSWHLNTHITVQNQFNVLSGWISNVFLDWAIANMAKALGNPISSLFYNRSQNYRVWYPLSQRWHGPPLMEEQNVWNSDEKFFCPKLRNESTGEVTWNCPPWYNYLNPLDPRYEEGNAWHWRCASFLPHRLTTYNCFAGGLSHTIPRAWSVFLAVSPILWNS